MLQVRSWTAVHRFCGGRHSDAKQRTAMGFEDVSAEFRQSGNPQNGEFAIIRSLFAVIVNRFMQ